MTLNEKTPAPGNGDGGSCIVSRGSVRSGNYTQPGFVATVTLRSIFNDDGHFLGLEVARG